MDDVGEEMVETYQTIGGIVEAILVEGKVERTPKIRELLNDLSTMVIHALGCRPPPN